MDDDDSDIEKEFDFSLGDLHHGLDSSIDDDALAERDATPTHDLDIMSGLDVSHTPDDQVTLLHSMVREMQREFQEAFQKLYSLSDKEAHTGRGADATQQHHKQQLDDEVIKQQKHQLDDLSQAVKDIQNQLTSLSLTVQELREENRSLREEQATVRKEREVEGPPNAPGKGTQNRPTQHIVPSNISSDSPQDSPTDSAITALACRSLNLSQALGDKCLRLHFANNSDEDDTSCSNNNSHNNNSHAILSDGRPEYPMISHYTPSAGRTDPPGSNRQHTTMSAQGRLRDVDRAAQRQRAVIELADSQRDYCSGLWSLLHTYLAPLQSAGFLSSHELSVLFPPYLEQLYAEHCNICTGLQDRLVHWTHMSVVADLLTRITDSHSADPVLSFYMDYAEDLPSAITCLRRALAHSQELKAFLKAIQQTSCEREELMSLILTPIQHLPKYLLLVQQVAGPTLPTHPDYPLLQSTLRQLQSFMEKLNEELTNTMEALNNDSHAGLSAENSGVFSARDKGAPSTQEDMNTSSTSERLDHSYILPQSLENSYYDAEPNFRPLNRAHPNSLSTLSQPDLTTYGNLRTSDPRFLAHIPRSRSTLPVGSFINGGGESGRIRHHRKYKVKKHHGFPTSLSLHPQTHHELQAHRTSTHSRPASAIDFCSHANGHYATSYNNAYIPSGGIQTSAIYPAPVPRPHSALGPLVSNSIQPHRPTIISRKHLRRSQPLMPATSSEILLSSLQNHSYHLHTPVTQRDILPYRHTQYPSTSTSALNVGVAGFDAEYDEDDAHASVTHSVGTTSSHHHSSSYGSNDGHDIDPDLFPYSMDGVRGQKKFTSQEVAENLAHELYSVQAQADDMDTTVVLRRAQKFHLSNGSISPHVERPNGMTKQQTSEKDKLSSIHSEKSHPDDPANNKNILKRGKMILDVESDEDQGSNNNIVGSGSSVSDLESAMTVKDPDVVISTNVYKSSGCPDTSSESHAYPLEVSTDEKRNGSSPSKSNVQAETERRRGKDRTPETNRQFLLSLSAKAGRTMPSTSTTGKVLTSNMELKTSPISGSITGFDDSPHTDNSISKNPRGLNDSSSCRHLLPKSKRSPAVPREGVIINGFGQPAKNLHIPRLSQPLPPPHGRTNGSELNRSEKVSNVTVKTTFSSDKISSPPSQDQNLTTSFFPLAHRSQHPHTSSLTGWGKSKTVPFKPEDPPSDSKTMLLNSKARLLFSYSPRGNATKTSVGPPLETAINVSPPHSEREESPIVEDRSPHELTHLSMSDFDPVFDTSEAGRRRDGRKKGKDGDKHHPPDELPKAGEDPVGVRKKMHLKSSLKNLFVKKRISESDV